MSDPTQHGVIRSYLNDLNTGYVIQANVLGYRYVWKEPNEPDDIGEFKPTLAEALRDAARDWDECGGYGNRASILRGAATKAEKAERARESDGTNA